MCAHTATPPDSSGRPGAMYAVSTCSPNHQINTIHAGIAKTRKKITKMNSMLTRTFGYSTRYAPSTPEIAPDAPTVGTGDAGCASTCARGGDQAAQQIEAQEAPRPHAVFDVVAEHPEEERVPEDVPPAAVQEHRDERREDVDRIAVDDAGERSAMSGTASPDGSPVGQLAGHHPEVADAPERESSWSKPPP